MTRVCVETCTLSAADHAQGTCDAGESCVANPAGFFELEPGDLACSEENEVATCNVAEDYRCLEVGFDAAGPRMRCARPTRFCAAPQPFFGFDSTLVPDASHCDLAGPTASGGRFCGVRGEGITDPARAMCFPLFEGVESVGACVGFCDPMLGNGATDLDCGAGASCVVPSAPQFFFSQEPEVLCGSVGTAACDAGYDRCVNFGNGPACARASKVCAPEGN